jgi:dihydroorotate dehydrogenase (fumarate)
MNELKTKYLGLDLNSPIIVSSSALTNSAEKIMKLEQLGAGAVVLKSIFEEQINYETSNLLQHNEYPEAADYILAYAKTNTVENYINLIKLSKSMVQIPIIASINCVTAKDWTDIARKFEEAGADGLELNIHLIITDKKMESVLVEEKYIEILDKVKRAVKIPIAIKIGNDFTNLANIVDKFQAHGAAGIVLFNRFYAPDIDIEKMEFTCSSIFSNPDDIRNSLRWVGLLSDVVKNIDISASTGVHDYKGAIKMLLAGAQTVQVCSTLYKNGLDELKSISEGLRNWIINNGYETVDDIRGILSYKQIKNPTIYERAQFMKYFSSVE